MERDAVFSIGEYYHIYNRGTEKRDIFLKPDDYLRFAFLLYSCNGTSPTSVRDFKEQYNGLPLAKVKRGDPIVDIGCWCLMSNHFHILVHEKQSGGITKFMLKLSTSYSMYFNKFYERSGRLFQGPFQSKYIDRDEYLNYLFAYIHLNPVKLVDSSWKEKGIKDMGLAKQHLSKYAFSSYLDFLGNNREYSLILNKEAFPDYFSSEQGFESFIEDWLTYQDYKG